MIKDKRNIKIVLKKLNKSWIAYAHLCKDINNLDYFIYVNEKSEWGKTFPDQIEFRKKYLEYLKKEIKILKEKIDDLYKQYKGCK